jgi:hypothetical protein
MSSHAVSDDAERLTLLAQVEVVLIVLARNADV